MKITDSYTISTEMNARRDGAEITGLKADSISITMTAEGEIKTAMTCFLSLREDLNLLQDHLCPVQIINGERFPMGEYGVATITPVSELGRRGWQVDAYDLGLVVQQTTVQDSYFLPAGIEYVAAVQQLLIDCGISRAIAQPSPYLLPADREWDMGTDYLTIINTLLKEITYSSLWFDREGVARVEPVRQQGVGTHVQYNADQFSILRERVTGRTDAYTAYNVFTVVVSTPDQPPMMATGINDSPLSPISTVSRGCRVCAPIRYLEGIPNQTALDAYVKQLVWESMQGYETVEFETLPIPEQWYDSPIILEGVAYRSIGWQITLGPGGTYTHTARRRVML